MDLINTSGASKPTNTAIAVTSIKATMTSRDIATLVESRHDDVKRSIERLVERGIISSPPMADFKNINNVTGKEYVFTGEKGKRDSIVVVAQLSPEFTARLVDRWQELESQASALPKDYPSALRALADEHERRQLIERELEASRPKIAFHDQVVSAETLIDFTQAFSLLQKRTGQKFKRRNFIEFLRRHGIACQPNIHANIGNDRFVPRKDYVGTWFVSELSPSGQIDWLMRPMAIAGIVRLIEEDRLTPSMLAAQSINY